MSKQVKKPTHIVYYVKDAQPQASEQQPYWAKVGALFVHKDGEGYDLTFDVPIAFDRLVVRVNKPKT